MAAIPKKKAWLALVPFVTFLVLYLGIGTFLTFRGKEFAFYTFPAPTTALIGFGIALIIGWRNLHGHIRIFVRGIGEETVILMCLIFMLAGAFATVTKAMGGVDSTVNMGLSFLPGRLILPGIFLISCFVSFAMGTSMGTIGAVAPIAMGLATKAGVPLPVTMGAVLGGAMFGDNLSVISDTTIAATSTQGCSMRAKMRMNFKIALPAAVLVLIGLLLYTKPAIPTGDYAYSFVKTIPYLAVFALALTGINVIAVLMIGIALASIIGMFTGSLGFVQFGKATYDGFISMAEVFFLTVLVSGLASMAVEQGGLEFILKKLKRLIRGKRTGEIGIASLVSIADVCTANNTVAIIVTGKMTRDIAQHSKVTPRRAASLMDIFSCVWQGILPYGAQLLLIGGLAKISPFTVIPYAWYPFALAAFAIAAIIFKYPKH